MLVGVNSVGLLSVASSAVTGCCDACVLSGGMPHVSQYDALRELQTRLFEAYIARLFELYVTKFSLEGGRYVRR